MTIGWILQIDFDNDGSFATTGDDISAYVKTFSGLGGLKDEDAHIADVGKLTIVLDNTTKLFSPAHATGTYYGRLVPNLPVQLTITDNNPALSVVAFRGVVEDWMPDSGDKHSKRECRVTCIDLLGKLQRATVAMPIQEDKSPDVILDKITAMAFDGDTAGGTLRILDTPVDDSTVTIGGTTYTFKSALTGVANEILTATGGGEDKEISGVSLAAAINADTGAGTSYGSGTSRHADVVATATRGLGYSYTNQDTDLLLRETGSGYDKIAMSFFAIDDTLTQDDLLLYLKKVGTPTGTATVRIETSEQSLPSGVLMDANATITFDEAGLGTSYTYTNVTFPGELTFLPYTRYHIVISTDRAAHAANYIAWGTDTSTPTFASGSTSTETGATWAAISGAACFWWRSEVILTANTAGAWGNAITLTSAAGTVLTSGATFSGGTDEPSGLTDFEAGQFTTPIIGDQWKSGKTNGLTAAADAVLSFQGYLYADMDGTITYQADDWVFKQQAVAASLTIVNQADVVLNAVSLGDIKNHITANYTPRRSVANTVVARAQGPIRVPGRSTTKRWTDIVNRARTTTTIPLVDSNSGVDVGATGVIAPEGGTDFTVRIRKVGGNDVTSKNQVSTTMVIKGGEIDVTFLNTANFVRWVHDFQIRGTKIESHGSEEIIASDAASIVSYGEQRKKVTVPSPPSLEFVESVIDYELGRFKEPANNRIKSVSFKGTYAVNGVHVLTMGIGDVIDLTDVQQGLSNEKLMVLGWKLNLGVDRKLTVAWSVRQLGDFAYWVIGDASLSLLGTTTRLTI